MVEGIGACITACSKQAEPVTAVSEFRIGEIIQFLRAVQMNHYQDQKELNAKACQLLNIFISTFSSY